uniref:Uncharacterized protein n=1 Tax=Arion vulgaris TaxID=1028688 RepID=A0A0B7BP86_9EUPU
MDRGDRQASFRCKFRRKREKIRRLASKHRGSIRFHIKKDETKPRRVLEGDVRRPP